MAKYWTNEADVSLNREGVGRQAQAANSVPLASAMAAPLDIPTPCRSPGRPTIDLRIGTATPKWGELAVDMSLVEFLWIEVLEEGLFTPLQHLPALRAGRVAHCCKKPPIAPSAPNIFGWTAPSTGDEEWVVDLGFPGSDASQEDVVLPVVTKVINVPKSPDSAASKRLQPNLPSILDAVALTLGAECKRMRAVPAERDLDYFV